MNNSLLKTAKDLNRYFNKGDIPMANTYIKVLKSFIIIELQTKTRYHYITIRIAKTQKKNEIKRGYLGKEKKNSRKAGKNIVL